MKNLSFQADRNLMKPLILSVALSTTVTLQASASTNDLQGYVMDIQMTPAVCSLDRTKLKQRKCMEGYSLTITGLIPETSSTNCSTSSSAKLSPIQAQVVSRVMPDEAARAYLWKTVGKCTPMTASQYFRDIINKAQNLKIPLDVTGIENKTVQKINIINQFYRINPKLKKNSLILSCQINRQNRAILTRIQVCYAVNGQYKPCDHEYVSNCPSSFDIKGSY